MNNNYYKQNRKELEVWLATKVYFTPSKNMALTQKEISHNHYQRRKDNGLCVRCGKLLDRKGHYCSECNEKQNEYQRKTRKFCIENKICWVCRKNKVGRDETICPECRAKRYSAIKPLTIERKEKYNKRFKKQQKALYKERKTNGICTRCGKRRAIQGKTKCGVCLERDAYNHMVARERKLKEA